MGARFWLETVHPFEDGNGRNGRIGRTLPVLAMAQDMRSAGRLFSLSRSEKYTAIAQVSRAAACRELTDLVALRLIMRTGEGRETRYALVGMDAQ